MTDNHLSRRRPRSGSLLKALIMAAALGGCASDGSDAKNRSLKVAATSDELIWNAVVADGPRIIVSGPRWAGGKGPQLAIIDQGSVAPFPDARWNSWKPGEPADDKFVNINALHRAPDGALWVVDTGSPEFGGDPLPGGAKIARIDLFTGQVTRVIHFSASIARKGSYIDDIRFNGHHAYISDAGRPGIIVIDLKTDEARRVLDGDPSTTASDKRPIQVDGKVLRAPDGAPLKVHSDPFEISPNRDWLMYGPLAGPWSRISTEALDNPKLRPDELAKRVHPFADLPPTGGTTIDAKGNLYYSELSTDSIKVRAPNGTTRTIAHDPRLHWVDAMYIDDSGTLWMPAAQVDRVGLFHGGRAQIKRPVQLFTLELPRGTRR
jgi:hypothetical protein